MHLQATQRSPTERDDDRIQSGVLALVLVEHPAQLTDDDIRREVRHGEATDRDHRLDRGRAASTRRRLGAAYAGDSALRRAGGPMTVAEQFGQNLRKARRGADLSQERLAELASLHRTAIGLLENGRRLPRIDTFVRLADSLGVPADELLDGIGWRVASLSQPGRFRTTETS